MFTNRMATISNEFATKQNEGEREREKCGRSKKGHSCTSTDAAEYTGHASTLVIGGTAAEL